MSFLPPNYKIPRSATKYMKFEEGENQFRILGSFEDETAIMGFEYWITQGKDRKPVRVSDLKEIDPEELEINPKTGKTEIPKHFWMLPVYNYKAKMVQLLEITQKSIQEAIQNLANNPKWGHPSEYDIIVTRIEEDIVKYTVLPDPKSPLDKEIADE